MPHRLTKAQRDALALLVQRPRNYILPATRRALESRGLIAASRPHDKHTPMLTITPAGRAALADKETDR